MILLGSFRGGAAAAQLSIFLPLALAGCATFALLSVQWLVQLFADEDQGSK